jgi:hypothetical protein
MASLSNDWPSPIFIASLLRIRGTLKAIAPDMWGVLETCVHNPTHLQIGAHGRK